VKSQYVFVYRSCTRRRPPVWLQALNLAVPALPGVLFSYFNEDLDNSASWSPRPDLIAGIRTRLVDAVRKLPRRYLLPPIDGELFESLPEAEERLLGYYLTAGFQVVGGSGGKIGAKKNFLCLHHGNRLRTIGGCRRRWSGILMIRRSLLALGSEMILISAQRTVFGGVILYLSWKLTMVETVLNGGF
jgi:hypothetical protein